MTQNWNTALYEGEHSFVWQLGESLLQWLAPQPGERILDLGCGTGQLTDKIASTGSQAWGIDFSAEMIETARASYPHLRFTLGDARDFAVDEPLDAVFSNAVLHWIPDADAPIASIYRALKPGGRFVAEFGGKGNVAAIAQAITNTLETMGHTQLSCPWYFPSIGDYATRLERQGFEVIQATLSDRPTPLAGEEAGLANWLRMFATGWLSPLSDDEKAQVIATLEDKLRSKLYHDGGWIADYRRIRLLAYKF
jgi:trans-aconitate 2-methyltransferase